MLSLEISLQCFENSKLPRISITSQQLEQKSQQLEARVAVLEKELVQMKELLSGFVEKKPWWLKVAGSFEDDPTFDEAVSFGREWRESAE